MNSNHCANSFSTTWCRYYNLLSKQYQVCFFFPSYSLLCPVSSSFWSSLKMAKSPFGFSCCLQGCAQKVQLRTRRERRTTDFDRRKISCIRLRTWSIHRTLSKTKFHWHVTHGGRLSYLWSRQCSICPTMDLDRRTSVKRNGCFSGGHKPVTDPTLTMKPCFWLICFSC